MINQVRLNSFVVCTDGPVGRLTDLVLHRSTERVTNLVVESPRPGYLRHMLSVGLLEASDEAQVRLHCSRADVDDAERFVETETIPVDAARATFPTDDLLGGPV